MNALKNESESLHWCSEATLNDGIGGGLLRESRAR